MVGDGALPFWWRWLLIRLEPFEIYNGRHQKLRNAYFGRMKSRKMWFWVVLCLFVGAKINLQAQNFNRIHPPNLFDYEFELFDSTDTRKYLFTIHKRNAPSIMKPLFSVPLIFAANGYALWYGTDTLPLGVRESNTYPPKTSTYIMLIFPFLERSPNCWMPQCSPSLRLAEL